MSSSSSAERAIQFLKGVVPGFPPAITEGNLCKYLRSGVVLCNTLNALQPGLVATPKLGFTSHRTNVENFNDGCRRLGVGTELLVEPDDVINERNPEQTFRCIRALADLFAAPAARRPPPKTPQQQAQLAQLGGPPPAKALPTAPAGTLVPHRCAPPPPPSQTQPPQGSQRAQPAARPSPVAATPSAPLPQAVQQRSWTQQQQQQQPQAPPVAPPKPRGSIVMTSAQQQQFLQMQAESKEETAERHRRISQLLSMFLPRRPTPEEMVNRGILLSHPSGGSPQPTQPSPVSPSFPPPPQPQQQLHASSSSSSPSYSPSPLAASMPPPHSPSFSSSAPSASSPRSGLTASREGAPQSAQKESSKKKLLSKALATLRGFKPSSSQDAPSPSPSPSAGGTSTHSPLAQSTASHGDDAAQALRTLSDSLMTMDDVVAVATSYAQMHPMSATRRGERFAMENASLRDFTQLLRVKLAFERQRAHKAMQGERISQLDKCSEVLEMETPLGRDLLTIDGKVDTVLENMVIKLELRALLYELGALKMVLNMADEVATLKTKSQMLQQMCQRLEAERRTMVSQFDQAMATPGGLAAEEGLLFETNKKDPAAKPEIRGGTVDKLIERLYNKNVDSIAEYVDTFLITYRSFTDGQTVLSASIAKYRECALTPEEQADTSLSGEQKRISKKKTLLRVCNFIRRWVEHHFYDFDDPELLASLRLFIAENQDDKLVAEIIGKKLNAAELQHNQPVHRSVTFDKPPPPPIIPITVSFDELDPLELARQLTLIEYDLYRSIRSHELLSCSWSKKDKETKSPNLLRMIQHFNDLGSWVTCSVVREPSLKRRASVVRKFLRVIEEAQKLNNFFAVFSISAGLNSSPISRLKKTWEELTKEKVSPDKVMVLTTPQGNFAVYRDMLRNADPPLIPYIGQYLSDLTFIEDGNPDTLENGAYVNFAKFRMVAKSIQDLQRHQMKPYNLTRVESIVHFLERIETITEKEAFDLSLQIEPREPRPQPT